MKKIMLFLAIVFAMNANAQTNGITVSGFHSYYLRAIPPLFSYGDNYFFTNDPYENSVYDASTGLATYKCNIDVYNDDIELVKKVQIYTYQAQRTYTGEDDIKAQFYAETWEIAKDCFGRYIGANVTYIDDANHIIEIDNPDIYYYWNASDKYFYMVRKLFTETPVGLATSPNKPTLIRYYDLFNGPFDYTEIFLTQTLFNDDDKFEWLAESYDAAETMTGYDIVQEGGTVLGNIPCESNYYPYLYKMNDKYYIAAEKNGVYIFFRVNKNVATGVTVQKVNSIPGMNVYNINGQRLNGVPQRGIYIQDGKKHVVK